MHPAFRTFLLVMASYLQVLMAAESVPVSQQLADLKGRFKAQYDIEIRSAQGDGEAFAAAYDVTLVADANLANTLQVLGWVEDELKRYPAGFLKHHGPRHLVLAEAFLSKRLVAGAKPISQRPLNSRPPLPSR